MKHENNGHCPKCQELLGAYPNFYAPLRQWFEGFQSRHPEAHISEAGRGALAQERDFQKGVSRAHFGRSAHNFNCALDLFSIVPGKDIYDKAWFSNVLAKNLEPWINWYGAPGAKFPELPHVEPHDWEKLGLALVEPKGKVA